MRKGLENRIAGFIVLAAGGLTLWEAWKLYGYRSGQLAGDHVFPGLAGIGLFICGIALLIHPGRKPEKEKEEDQAQEQTGERRDRWRMAALPVILLGYTLILPTAGYVIGTFTAAFLLFRTVGSYSWLKCLAGAMLTTFCLDLIFIQWLHTPLPVGRLIRL